MEGERTDNMLSIDEILKIVGEYGCHQKVINFIFCVMAIPSIFQTMLMSFAAKDPTWRCVKNSSICLSNNTHGREDNYRCLMPRNEWEFTIPKEYSIAVQFDLSCDREWLIELSTSILFVGWMFGATVLGWCADNFGRKIVLFTSINMVLIVAFTTVFLPNFYLIIASRFVVGFFMHGTFPQMYVIISELVGNKQRSFVNVTIFIFVSLGWVILGIKAYLIKQWKVLYMVCTGPYIFVIIFYPLVPESVRYLRVKGRLDEAMLIFRKIASWNKKVIPSVVTILPPPSNGVARKSSPLDLFRPASMASKSIIQAFASLVSSMSFYSLYLAAGNISGNLYRDFIILSAIEIPSTVVVNYFTNRFGRKKTTIVAIILASIACVGLGVTPRKETLKLIRLILAIFGVSLIVGSGLSLQIWSVELYPTHIRGEGMGFLQVMQKIGAASSSWINKEFMKLHTDGSFLFVGVLSFISGCLLKSLPETKELEIADVSNEMRRTPQSGQNLHSLERNKVPAKLESNVTSYTNAIIETQTL